MMMHKTSKLCEARQTSKDSNLALYIREYWNSDLPLPQFNTEPIDPETVPLIQVEVNTNTQNKSIFGYGKPDIYGTDPACDNSVKVPDENFVSGYWNSSGLFEFKAYMWNLNTQKTQPQPTPVPLPVC